MVALHLAVAWSAFVVARLEEAQQGVAAIPEGGLVFHVQEVPGGLQRAERTVLHIVGEQPGIGGRGVLVPFTVQEQHRHVDVFRRPCVAAQVALEHFADVEMHLPVLMLGQAADMAMVEALEQRRQMFADGAVDQMPHAVAVQVAQVIDATLKVVAHRRVENR